MAIDALTEEVAANLEEAAEATRMINTSTIKYFVGGVVLGVGIGFYFGWRYRREQVRAEAFKASEAEVEKIRDLYQQRSVVREPKPAVEDVIREKGYDKNPTEVNDQVSEVFPLVVVPDDETESKEPDWIWETEMANRSEKAPYVIHEDEFTDNKVLEFKQVTYTYYALDDVLVDEDERPLPHADLIVGQDNLKFGHGAGNIDVVFVRNHQYELDMEIWRVEKSYEEEVLGIGLQMEDDDENDTN